MMQQACRVGWWTCHDSSVQGWNSSDLQKNPSARQSQLKRATVSMWQFQTDLNPCMLLNRINGTEWNSKFCQEFLSTKGNALKIWMGTGFWWPSSSHNLNFYWIFSTKSAVRINEIINRQMFKISNTIQSLPRTPCIHMALAPLRSGNNSFAAEVIRQEEIGSWF